MKIRLIASAGFIAYMLIAHTGSADQSSPVVISNYHVATHFTVPANPYGLPTPDQLNYAVFTRYRYNPEPSQIKAILVLMPGLFGGAADFDRMAKTIVQMGKGDIEVWAVDRRSVLLDDLTGMREAWNKRDPSIALGYYFSGATVNGKTYAGSLLTTPASISYMSEWGIDMILRDLNMIISLVPRQYRKTNVFLGGHSLGAFIAQDYAAYDFGNDPTTTTNAGFNNIAGVILLDGGGSNLFHTTPTRGAYLTGTGLSFTASGTPYNLPSVYKLETTPSYITVAGLMGRVMGPDFLKMFAFAQIEGMLAMIEPHQLSTLLQCSAFQPLASFLLGNTRFKATNRAMLGFALDRNFNPINIMSATLGSANGPLTSTTNPFMPGAAISQPTDRGTLTYTWNSTGHITNISDVAAALSNTYTVMTEQYFPSRLLLDSLALADYGPTQTTDWRYRQGIHVIHTHQMDAPVIAFG